MVQLRSMLISGEARIDFSPSARAPYSKQEAKHGFQSAAKVNVMNTNIKRISKHMMVIFACSFFPDSPTN